MLIIITIMEQTYLIAWKCQTNGRIGRSKNPITLKEAQQLAAQLNQEHPEFEHVPIPASLENFSSVFTLPKPKKATSLETLLEPAHSGATKAVPEELVPEEELVFDAHEEVEAPELDALKEA